MIKDLLNSTLQELNTTINSFPEDYKLVATFIIYFILIAVYSIFIWKFYRFLAKRNIIKLNLRQYNKTTRPILNKFLASIFYIIEHIIIMPILVLFWFSILAIFLLLLSKEQTTSQILIIAAAVIGAVRFSSYISEDLSKDIAKLLPFTILGIFLISPNFFSVSELTRKIAEIPSFFTSIFIFLMIVAGLEIVIRIFYLMIGAFIGLEEDLEEEEKQE